MSQCKVEGCERSSRRRGMCPIHYYRWKRYGDPGPVGLLIERHGKHGTKVYATWHGIKQRCFNPYNINFPRYGALGITMCAEWCRSFSAFYRDMRDPPSSKYQIDRINSRGNYENGNCRWVLPVENLRNRSFIKLTMEKAREIRMLKTTGMLNREIAELFDIKSYVVSSVLRGVRWREEPAYDSRASARVYRSED